MPSKPHKLGTYSAIRNDYCVYLELKAASDDGHIDTEKGIYFAHFDFWYSSAGAYAKVGYNAKGFNGVFAQIRDFLPGVALVIGGKSDIGKGIANDCLERCIADLEKQTELLGAVTELPPTPMCSDEPRARPTRAQP
jgi:hypothetical protein